MNKKWCSTCKKEKDIVEFSKNPTKKDGLCSKCKTCQNDYAKLHYKNNKNKYFDLIKEQNKKKKQFLYDQKYPCSSCGESDKACLDFHHTDSKTKAFNLSSYKNHSLDKIKKEIEKCIVLCANCHRKLHAYGLANGLDS